MKSFLYFLLVLAIFASCNDPMRVTANPNSTSATSGTLGSVKASDGTRPAARDSLRVKDSLKQ